MVYECPSSSCNDTSFYNANQYKIHDYPPTPFEYKAFLRPLRYSSMNGNAYPSYLMDEPDPHLLSHWIQTIPNFVCPEFVCTIPPTSKIYAYLPTENLPNHVHDPDVHYELAGKRAINLMTDHAPRLLPNTKDIRPCVTKVTHGMGSLGVFVIANDEDEAEFEQFVQDTGKPTYVITEFVNIQRNLSCHFFIHPNGDLIWFGSSENLMLSSGKWSSDSTIDMDQQKYLQDLQAPYAAEVADYCRSSGYWGFCGIDVLINTEGVGFVVDVNPRVTGTMPALMVASQIQSKFGYRIGKFRKSSKCIFPGSAEELFHKVDEYNADHQGNSIVVVFSIHEMKGNMTRINVGAFGYTHEVCESLLDCFAPFVDVWVIHVYARSIIWDAHQCPGHRFKPTSITP